MAYKKKMGRKFVGESDFDLDEPEEIFQDAIKPSDRHGYIIKYVHRNKRHKPWFEHGKVRVLVKDGKPV